MRQAGEIALLVLIPLISVIGAFGNFILLTFFIKKQFTGSSLASKLNSSITSQRLTTNTFIMVLAANDFIASILVMPLTLIYEVSPQLIFTTDLMCKFYYFVTTSVIPFSAFLIVAIAIDRYLCIVHPLKVLLTPCRARVLVVILAVLSSTMGSLVAIGFSVRIDDDFSSFTAPTLPSFIQRRINNSNTNSSSSLYKISIDSRTPSTPFLHNASLLRFSDIQFGSPDQIPPHFANSFGDKILLTTTVSNTANFTLQQHPKPSVNKSSAALSAKDIAELIAQANQRQGIHRQEGLQAQKPLVKDQDNQCVRITIFDERFSDIYQIIHNTLIFGLAFTVPFVLYAIIYCRISKRQLQKVRRKSACSKTLLQNTSVAYNLEESHIHIGTADNADSLNPVLKALMSVSENTTSPTNQPAGYLELPTLVESAEVDLTATTAANLNDNLTPENNEDVTTSLLEVNQTKETKTTLSPPVSRNGRDLTMRISLPAKLDHPDHPVCDKGARGRVSSGAALESSKSESNSSTRHRAITRIWSNFSRASSASKNQGGTNSLNRQHSTTSSTFRLLSSERSSQIRLAAMLFVVTLVFLLAYLPALIVNTALSNQGDAWNRFIFYIYFVNNAANPLIYGIMNKQFRSEMLKAYFRC